MDCRQVKHSLLRFIDKELMVTPFPGHCTVTLPLMTLDGRYIDVHVEEVDEGRRVEVHDGGRAASELYAQGIHLAASKRAVFGALAKRYGARFDEEDDTFRMPTGSGDVQDAILAIAQCASLAMHDVLLHKPVAESVRVPSLVRRALASWTESTTKFDVYREYLLEGVPSKAAHRFDYLAVPTEEGARQVAVQVLSRSFAPRVQAERYGFMVLDIRGTAYDSWPRIAVVSNAKMWGQASLDLVESMSAVTIAVGSGRDAVAAIKGLPGQIERLAYAA